MPKVSCHLPLAFPILCLVIAGILQPLAAVPASRFDKNAQSLGKHLRSTPPAKKANPADLKNLKSRMIALIEIIEQSDRTGSTNAESLMTKAMYFKEDMANYEKMVTSNAIITAWEDARHYGLLNSNGKFEDRITKGRHSGDPVIFELIIPAERYPKGSNQLANLRIVPLKEKREEGQEMSPRDLAFGRQLVKMVNEKQGFAAMKKRETTIPTNAIGKTREQAKSSWEREVKAIEGALEQVPRIRIESGISGTPSHKTKGRWRLTTEIRNASRHPTEIKVTVYMIGQTGKKRAYYLMAKKEHTLQLRQNETRELETFSNSEGSYKARADEMDQLSKEEKKNSIVSYRGNIIVAKHKDKEITFFGSDSRLSKYADSENNEFSLGSIPSFF